MSYFEDVIRGDQRYATKARIDDLLLLEPITRLAVTNIIRDAAAMGIPLMVFETFRSQPRQQALFAAGSTQLQRVGVHHYGLACDLVKSIHGEPSWKGDFGFLATLAKRYGLISGSAWNGTPNAPGTWTDACHVQRLAVPDQERLFAIPWYPDETYTIG